MPETLNHPEIQEKEYPPLTFEEFKKHQNNFFLQFIDDPLNWRRYQIPPKEIVKAIDRFERGEKLSYPLNPLIVKLQEENPELEKNLTKEITEGDKERIENIERNMHLLYEAYLIQRKYLDPQENEGTAFDFNIFYPEKK